MQHDINHGTHKPAAYRSEIDGLRAIAVAAVVIFHAFPSILKGGFIGVDIFFVISGFLITTIIFDQLDRQSFSFKAFYSRRIRRIFPALIIVMIGCLVAGWFLLFTDEYAQLGWHVAGGAAFIANLIFWQEAGYFDAISETKPLLHLWSLGVEEQFYMIWPIVLWFAARQKYHLLKITLAVAFLSLLGNLIWIADYPSMSFYLPFTRLWELLAGSVLAWLGLHGYLSRLDHLRLFKIRLIDMMAMVGFMLLLLGMMTIHQGLNFPGALAIIPVIGVVLIISAGTDSWFNRKILSHPIAVGIGIISYPLYLWHWPLLSFAWIMTGGVPDSSIRILAVALAVVLAFMTYRLVEVPIRFRQRPFISTKYIAMAMAGIGIIGLWLHHDDGVGFRSAGIYHLNNQNEILRTVVSEQACKDFIGIAEPLFYYCRIHDIGAKQTVAIIGDSHAHTAYPGIAAGLAQKGFNVVMLGHSSCPPLRGVMLGGTQKDRIECQAVSDQILDAIIARSDIQTVLITNRASFYWTGYDPAKVKRDGVVVVDQSQGMISKQDFMAGTKATLDWLYQHDKKIYYISENPEWPVEAQYCIARPFKSEPPSCRLSHDEVMQRQADYRQGLEKLQLEISKHAVMAQRVIILDAVAAFCTAGGECQLYDDHGKLLYMDNNHLSIAGSYRQYEQLIAPLFNQP